jgi:FemAB-related protein (PEP-CTERM system-associated)
MLSVAAQPSADWDAYVRARPDATLYLQSGWSLLAKEVFGHATHFIEYRDSAARLRGVLPIVQQKTLLFGNYATSVPFFNYGGALGDDDEIVAALMSRGRELASGLGCRYLELRDAKPHPGEWIVRTDKVSMVLRLPATTDALAKQLGAKLRSQVKRAERESPSVRLGGQELLNEFYAIFSRTMRDLGTPVYPKRFFEALIRRFPQECTLVVVDRGGQPVATGWLVISRGAAEIPWAACNEDAKPAGFNMRLYWELLAACVARGCTTFDFGRSTVDSGTYRFKKQWGAEPVQLYWHRWERNPSHEDAGRPDSQRGLMQKATAVWRRMPLPLANALGPLVSPGLPW